MRGRSMAGSLMSYHAYKRSGLSVVVECTVPVSLSLQRLLQRYQNVKSELETQQNLERIRMDRYAGQTAETMGIAGRKKKKKKN